MKQSRLRTGICLMFGLFIAGAGQADTIVLKNGDRLTGTVDSVSGGHVLLQTEYAGRVSIKTDAVAQISTDASFNVRTDAGRSFGQFAVQGDQQALVSDAGSAPVELTAITTAGQSNLKIAQLGSEWSSRADLSAIISTGNSDTESYNTLIESVLKHDKVQHSVSLLLSNEAAEAQATKDQLDLDYGYRRFISEKWYASGNAEYFQDRLKDIDERITLGVGMGYQFWDDSFGALSTDLGISYVREELDGDQQSNPAVRWGLDYQRFLLSKKMEFFHKQSVLFIPDSDRGEVIATSTGLRYALNARIDTTARVDMNHETKPAEGNSKTDVTYTLGVGIKF